MLSSSPAAEWLIEGNILKTSVGFLIAKCWMNDIVEFLALGYEVGYIALKPVRILSLRLLNNIILCRCCILIWVGKASLTTIT